MAKSDSFFIRATAAFNGTSFNQVSVDLGAYVDALGKSVLRIHNIQTAYGGPLDPIVPSPTQSETLAFQLTTQSQSSMVTIDDKSVIASGKLQVIMGNAGVTTPYFSDRLDIAPQHWTNGYLVGVEQIYLGVDSTDSNSEGIGDMYVCLECTVETLSQSGAMALALSQQ